MPSIEYVCNAYKASKPEPKRGTPRLFNYATRTWGPIWDAGRGYPNAPPYKGMNRSKGTGATLLFGLLSFTITCVKD